MLRRLLGLGAALALVLPAPALAGLSSSESALLRELNRVRAEHGLGQLRYDPHLERAARACGLVRAFPAWRFLKVISANSSTGDELFTFTAALHTYIAVLPVRAVQDHERDSPSWRLQRPRCPTCLETHGSAPRVR